MDPDQTLPFEVGQVAESRSFLSGFRGAWFRCKVMAIRKKHNKLGCSLDFYDYPDEKQRWLQICQKPPYRSRKSQMDKESKDETLMLRPAFPHVVRESEMSQGHLPTSPNVAVVVRDVWAVGDLVDLWRDDCYWSCKVTKILQGDKVQVELHPSPVGEGGSYEVCSKDLRPSLDWFPEHGWTVPVSNGHGVCARLVQPQKEVEERASECVLKTFSAPFPSESSDNSLGTEDGERENLDEKQDTDNFFRASSHGKGNHLEKKQDTIICSEALSSHPEETNVDRKHDIRSCFKATGSPGEGEAIRQEQEIISPSKASSSWREGKVLDVRQEINCSKASTLLSEAKGGDKEHDIRSFRKAVSLGEGKAQGIGSSSKPTSSHGERKNSGNREIYLKRPRSGGYGCGSSLLYYDTIESSIVELEELVNKIRWLKGLLCFGVKWSNEMKSSWKLEPALHKSR